MKKVKISENFLGQALFTFDNFTADCFVDTNHISADEIEETIKVARKNSKVKFAFEPTYGLVRINTSNGAVEEKNILNSFISIKEDNIENYRKFFLNNGFIFPLNNELAELKDVNFLELVHHTKATLELMSQISEIARKDCKKMLINTLYLMFSSPFELSVGNYKYVSNKHERVNALLNKAWDCEPHNHKEPDQDWNWHIKDTIYGEYKIHMDIANHIIDDIDEEYPEFWKKVCNAYVNYNGTTEERKIIDFLYHIYFDIGEFHAITNEEIEFNAFVKPKWDKFDEKMKHALEDIAKIIVGDEINSNLKGIRPQYNISNMEPSWQVDDLLSAMYFSIFYMKPNLELTRKCANPNCSNYFTVSRTSSKKKYCCQECANRAAQNKFRAKKKGLI